MVADEASPFIEDDPGERVVNLPIRPLPERAFALASDGAIAHAADPARRDPDSDTLTWAPTGPRNIGGRIRCLVQDPQNPRILYAGSDLGGVWKTATGGDTWRPVGPALRENKDMAAAMGAIGLCHREPLHIYAGTGDPVPGFFGGYGIFYSDDGGTRFVRIARPVTGPATDPALPAVADRIERIVVDPWAPKRAWLATDTGLWRSRAGANATAPPVFGATADLIDAAPVAGNPQDVTDVAIDFGDRTQAAPPATYTVFAAVRGLGVFRATFDTATTAYRVAAGVSWTRIGAAAAPGGFVALPTLTAAQLAADGTRGRTRLALCEAQPAHLYFIMCLNNDRPSRVFHSDDSGARWRQRAAGPEAGSSIGWYALTLEVHPTNAAILVAGSVHLARSFDNGRNWTRILDADAYDRGDRAQHADQHAALFDRGDVSALLRDTVAGTPQRLNAERVVRVWSVNDGGISLRDDRPDPPGGPERSGRTVQGAATPWRKRSHGILAAQFYDVTVHPTFPFITGGGLQDNGTWVGFGGPSWYYLDSADGGAIGFEPNDPRRFLTTTQGGAGSQGGLDRTVIASPAAAVGGPSDMVNPIPDVDLPGVGLMRAHSDVIANNFAAADRGVFGGRLEAEPGAGNRWIIARRNRAYRSVNGTAFNPIASLPAFTGTNPNVTAIAFSPSAPATNWWIGTSNGQIFRTTDGGNNWTPLAAAPLPPARTIADIAVHPQNVNVVAVAVDDSATQVFFSNDAGATWIDLGNSAANAADRIGPSPAACVRFDPRGGAALTDPQTLYVGTAAGVYVARGVVPRPAGGAAPVAVWRTINSGMPLVLVQDMAFAEIRDAAGNVTQRLLRAATFGRGLFEVDLAGTPAVRLLIRSTVIDDGHAYTGTQVLTFDPRLRRGPAPGQVALDHHRAFDIRVDAPISFDVGEVMDGAEFDERLRHGVLRRGDFNHVYVQVRNTGFRSVDGVRVGLFFARLDAGGNAPNLDADRNDAGRDFWALLRGGTPPAPDLVWQRAGEVVLREVGPGQPQVARFVWNAPLDLPRDVALLALATHPEDALGTPTPTVQVDPRPHGAGSLVRAERRAALRIARSQGGLFTRDAIDDPGAVGNVAWGARSLDIVVRQAAEANPDAAFAALFDRRAADRLLPGVRNHIFVRVHNRQAAQVQARVRLLRAAFPGVAPATGWQPIGEATVAVPANATRFTRPGFTFDAPADVAPGLVYKAMLLVALIGTDNDPLPDPAQVTDLAAFWRFVAAAAESNNVVCRAMRVGGIV